MRRALIVTTALLPLAAFAQGDPLQAPECRAALDSLATQEAKAGGPALADARGRAAKACLGSRPDAPARAPQLSPPIAVPSAVIPPPPLRAATPMPPAPAPVTAPPPPSVITCDAATCLTTDGQRLLRSGPTLIGPRGNCTVQAGGVVTCP